MAVDWWVVTFGTARMGLGEAHPSTASVPITVLLYNDPLLCGWMCPLKGFTCCLAVEMRRFLTYATKLSTVCAMGVLRVCLSVCPFLSHSA